MFSLEGLSDKIRNNTVGVAMAAFVTASTALGGSLAHAQDNVVVGSVPTEDGKILLAQSPSPESKLNTNPLSLTNKHWEHMKKIAKKTRVADEAPHVRIGRMIPGKYDDNPGDDYGDNWLVLENSKGKQVKGIVPNIDEFMKYVRSKARKKAMLDVVIGVIYPDLKQDDARLLEVQKSAQQVVDVYYKDDGGRVAGVFKVIPDADDKSKLNITPNQMDKGVIFFIRGEPLGNSEGNGIFTDDSVLGQNVWAAHNAGYHTMNNIEYNLHVRQIRQRIADDEKARLNCSDEGGKGKDGGGKAADECPITASR